jgi:hypothetical protein
VRPKKSTWYKSATRTRRCTLENPRPTLAAHQKRTQVELRCAPRLLVSGRTRSTSTSPCAATTRLRPHALYVDLVVRREYSSPGHSGSTSTSPCIATTRHPAARALRQPCRAPRVLVSRPQRLYIDYAVHRRDIVFWAYDYLDYLPRLVSTRKLVEDGSRDINN